MSRKITKRIACPICKKIMMPMRCEYPDSSGWAFGWSCDCTDEMRDKKDRVEIIISKEDVTVKYPEKWGEAVKNVKEIKK